MDAPSRYLEIVYTDSFLATAKGVLDQADFRELELQLIERPERGTIMQATGGVRKMRFALPGRGQSGGARVIYFYANARGRIYLIGVFKKAAKANLTKEEQNALRALAQIFQQER